MLTALIPIGIFLLPSLLLLFFVTGLPRKGAAVSEGKKLLSDRDEEGLAEKFIACIKLNKLFMRLVTGEANYHIFTEGVTAALKDVRDVEIILGPIVSVNDNRISYLIEAGLEKGFRFYRADKRPSIHFRVGETHLYIERPHPPMSKVREFLQVKNMPREIKRHIKRFDKLRKAAHPCKNVREEFVFLTEGDLRKVAQDRVIPEDINKMKETLREMSIPIEYGNKE